jgi:hypothetical protein
MPRSTGKQSHSKRLTKSLDAFGLLPLQDNLPAIRSIPYPMVYYVRPCPLKPSSSQGGENACLFASFCISAEAHHFLLETVARSCSDIVLPTLDFPSLPWSVSCVTCSCTVIHQTACSCTSISCILAPASQLLPFVELVSFAVGRAYVLQRVVWVSVCSGFSAGSGVVALKSHFVRFVVVVLESVGEEARLMSLELLSMMDTVLVDDLRNVLVSGC